MARAQRPRYEGDPTILQIMLRPRWIAALLLAIAVAAGFAWLGRWQLGHAVQPQTADISVSDTPRPITDVALPGTPVTDEAGGMVVTLRGQLAPGDLQIVERRTNGGREGAWVTAHVAVSEPGSGAPSGHLAVAVGWAPSVAEAERARDLIAADAALFGTDMSVAGRYMPGDAAEPPAQGDDPLRVTSMVPAQQVNLWQPFDGPAYAGYLVLHPEGAIDDAALRAVGLDPIDSVPPLPVSTINWLNVFYAAEWVVFAGFAVFFWFRLVRDAWEKEHELLLLAADA